MAFVQLHAGKNNAGEVMKQLVTGKLDELHEEFRVLFQNMDAIIRRALEMSGCDNLFCDDPAGQRALALLARRVLFQQWSSFQRRIMYPLRQCPVVSGSECSRLVGDCSNCSMVVSVELCGLLVWLVGILVLVGLACW